MDLSDQPPLLLLDIRGVFLVGPDDNHHRGIRTQSQDAAGKSNWGILCPLRSVYPHSSHPDRCQQLRGLLQEPALEERGGTQEEGADHAAGSRAQGSSEVPPHPGEACHCHCQCGAKVLTLSKLSYIYLKLYAMTKMKILYITSHSSRGKPSSPVQHYSGTEVNHPASCL